MWISYNELPKYTKRAIKFIRSQVPFRQRNLPEDDRHNTTKVLLIYWIEPIKQNNLMSPEIEEELFPLIFGENNENER